MDFNYYFFKIGNFFKIIPVDKVDYAEFNSVSQRLIIQANNIVLPEIGLNEEKFNNIFGSISQFKKVNESVYVNHNKAILDTTCNGVYVGEKYFEFTFFCCRSIWRDK